MTMNTMKEFRKSYPNGKIDVTCDLKDSIAYVAVIAYSDFNSDVDKYLARYQSICFEPNQENLKDAIHHAVINCMMCAGVFIPNTSDNEVSVTENTVDKPAPVKSRRGRKPKAETEKTTEAELPMPAMTADEAVQHEEAVEQLVKGLDSVVDVPTAEKESVSEPIPEEAAEYDVDENDNDKIVIETMQDAKQYKIPCGMHKNKYMGELLATNKEAVEYFATKYKGTDTNVRIAARIVLGLDQPVEF